MEDSKTSIPGQGNDPIEPDFEKQLANEGLTLEGREPVQPDKKPDEPPKIPVVTPEVTPPVVPPKVEQKPEDKKPGEEDGKLLKNEPWREKVANRREASRGKDKIIADQRAEIDRLKSDPKAPLNPADPNKSVEKPVLSEEQKSLAEKYGIEPEDFLKMFPTKEVIKEVVKSGLSPEQEALLSTLQAEKENQSISEGFRNDFEENVLPLIKAEYPNISDEKIKEIKSQIFEKIQTEQYSMTPLSTLYKGADDFRGVVTIPKKTFDEGSKVPSNSGNKVYDFENVTDADMKSADFPFEKYSTYMESKEKGAKRN